MPCSRAAERQLLRKIEHYSFISFFHLMPAKPEPFQSLMHYSHLWAASQTLFVGIMKRKTCCSTILLITLQILYLVWIHVLYFGMRIFWHAYLFSWPERERRPPVCWGRGSPGSAALWCPPHSLWLSWSECTAEECRYPSRTEKRKWFTTWSATKEIQIPYSYTEHKRLSHYKYIWEWTLPSGSLVIIHLRSSHLQGIERWWGE